MSLGGEDIMKTIRIDVRGVFYQEDGRWFAHLLEMGLIGDGESQEEALRCLAHAMESQLQASLELNDIDNLIHPAPPELYRMYAHGSDTKFDGNFVLRWIAPKSPSSRVTLESGPFREFIGSALAAC